MHGKGYVNLAHLMINCERLGACMPGCAHARSHCVLAGQVGMQRLDVRITFAPQLHCVFLILTLSMSQLCKCFRGVARSREGHSDLGK